VSSSWENVGNSIQYWTKFNSLGTFGIQSLHEISFKAVQYFPWLNCHNGQRRHINRCGNPLSHSFYITFEQGLHKLKFTRSHKCVIWHLQFRYWKLPRDWLNFWFRSRHMPNYSRDNRGLDATVSSYVLIWEQELSLCSPTTRTYKFRRVQSSVTVLRRNVNSCLCPVAKQLTFESPDRFSCTILSEPKREIQNVRP
jgi:hypothetical protein